MILMIDNYDSFTYNLVQEMRGLGADIKTIRNDEIDVAGIAALAPQAIVLSPGPGNPDSAGVTLEAAKAFAGKVPILGICLGHQSIAQAFGARIVPAKRLMHGKTSRIRHDGRGIFAGVPQDFEAMRYHSLAVDRDSLPDCLEVSAESEDGEIMGLRHKTLAVESVQYHPESIGTPEGLRQLGNFLARVTGTAPSLRAASVTEQRDATEKVRTGHDLTAEESEAFFAAVMGGGMSESTLASFLTAYRGKDVTVPELAGAARAMRAVGVKIDADGIDPVDIVGTGGDGSNSFNVSTTAAFIAAGAGIPIAKHGNGAATSKCGAADVLAALGYNLSAPVAKVEQCLKEVGMAFLFARNLHPAMRFAAPVRKALGFRTIFNLLGPLTNPAGAKRHVIGVYDPKLAHIFAKVLAELGSTNALVVSGEGGLDEISPGGLTFISKLKDGNVSSSLFDGGAEYGTSYPVRDLAGGDASQNAQILLAVLRGEEREGRRAAAVLNAAAAILVSGKVQTREEAMEMAKESIDSGKALAKLQQLVEMSR